MFVLRVKVQYTIIENIAWHSFIYIIHIHICVMKPTCTRASQSLHPMCICKPASRKGNLSSIHSSVVNPSKYFSTTGADPDGARGVRTNLPGCLRLHILCVYLAWSSTDFCPAEPPLTKILASRVAFKGAFTHLGKIWDPQISSCCNWLWLLASMHENGRGFNIVGMVSKFSHTLHTRLNK